jgi:glycosyltransferase involved in cell wall biosynthesis
MPKFVPSLKDLPEPPPDKEGWPWTEESEPLPPQMPDGSSWPQISIVTPSYNQGCFIEETIRSILLQGYPNLQYIVIDGGSTDQTVEIIRKYEPWLDYWESKKDNGQVDAINKGLALVDGKIFNWINSDDYLNQNTLGLIARSFENFHVVAGKCRHFWEENSEEKVFRNINLKTSRMIYHSSVKYSKKIRPYRYHQPAVWLRTKLLEQCGGLDKNLHYWFDKDMMLRYLTLYPKVNYTGKILAHYRRYEQSKTEQSLTGANSFVKEKSISIKKLSTLDEFSSTHSYCDLFLRQDKWIQFVNYLRQSNHLSTLQKRLKIIQAIWHDPVIRLSRFTLGAIRKCY